ncbi:MAG TPA: serine hydrolase domain-containing protein [Polyangiaceae bacterium]
MNRRTLLRAAAALTATSALGCRAEETAMATKTTAGTASSPVREAIAGCIARSELPGAAWAVGRGGDVHFGTEGALRIGGSAPVREDTLFRIASMTKPMVAAVAMMLVDDGVLRLDAPVTRWLPELAERRVLARLDGPLTDTVPAQRTITVDDLLSFRMGFGLLWGKSGLPIQRAEKELHLGAFGPPRPQVPPATDEWMRRFATLPLMAQPGERWLYQTSAEVMGVLVARASGKPLEVVMRERLFGPLGMNDTGFFVPAEKMARLTTSYMASGKDGALELYDEAEGGDWSRPPAFPSAGGGLVSTVRDCAAFARMMNAGGTLGGQRILSATSVSAMTRDHIPAAQKVASAGSLDPEFWDHYGWGLGVSVVTHEEPEGPRGVGWDGGLGTSMWWDPKTQSFGVLLTQRSAYPKTSRVYRDFWRTAKAETSAA